MKAPLLMLNLIGLVTFAANGAETTYTTPAPADSGCRVYDLTDIIKSIDLNHDGKLSKEEWSKVGAPPSSYQMIEKDKKGYILPAEFVAVAPPPGIDTNKDCKITLDEMKAMEKSTPKGPNGPPPAGAEPPKAAPGN